mmetsp:Transcript_13359/g.23425  ORF Transcript_13359/g.23425 Transcript_13359/m.23425 type:complete len:142 (+) Transcript_13359:108-533(+)
MGQKSSVSASPSSTKKLHGLRTTCKAKSTDDFQGVDCKISSSLALIKKEKRHRSSRPKLQRNQVGKPVSGNTRLWQQDVWQQVIAGRMLSGDSSAEKTATPTIHEECEGDTNETVNCMNFRALKRQPELTGVGQETGRLKI